MSWLGRLLGRGQPNTASLPPPDTHPAPPAIPVASVGELPPADTRGRPVPEAAIDLIAKWEGFRGQAYLCPAGVWTIGYGTTRYEGGEPVRPGESIKPAAALELLRKQAAVFARDVDALVKVPLSAGERGALVSLAYNIGIGAFRDSTLLRLLNSGRRGEAAAQFDRWSKGSGKVLPGLVARRAQERLMFQG